MALSSLVNLGRSTVTGIIAASGGEFDDWSAAYRLFSEERFDSDKMFGALRNEIIAKLSDDAPIVAAMDDTILRKRGTKIPGVSYRRDPMGPRFHVNFVRAQRFLQLSMAIPYGGQPCGARMIPVDFRHAPTPLKQGKTDPTELQCG